MTIINAYPEDHQLLVICNDIPCDPLWEEVMKLVFNWANAQGLKGVRVSDLQIIYPTGNDPLNIKKWVKCLVHKQTKCEA